MAGRKTKRTPEAEKRFLDAIAAGNTRKTACAYAGWSEDSLANYLRDSSDFSDAIEKAEAAAVVRNVAIIQKAAQETWTAAAWWLERRQHDEWGRKDRLQQEHSGAVRVEVVYTDPDPQPA